MENNEKTVRLAKPRKKGIIGIIFSKYLGVFLLIIVQVLIIITIYMWLFDLLPFLVYIYSGFAIVMIIYLFNNRMDSSAKLTWMLIISLVPIAGAILLWMSQTNAGHRKEIKLVNEQIELSRDLLPETEETVKKAIREDALTVDLEHYVGKIVGHPVYDRTKVTYFPIGEAKFEAMLDELEKARKYIFLEYFIIDEGYMWGRILEVLIRKVKEGVDVRVMYDGLTDLTTLPTDYWKLLEKEGIKAKTFSPLKPILSTDLNYRDHRKILVIDGETAFNGGINLADEYINKIERFGHWKDTAIMLKGAAVQSFTLMFLQMWNIGEENPDYKSYLGNTGKTPADANGYVLPYYENPLDDYKSAEAVYIDILCRADKYVHIMTPYLILDDELKSALCFAAQRGVDVKLILPGIPDKKMAYALAKTHYIGLIKSGVKIYEYTPGFVHAKIFVSDDIRAVVGTINLDYRSLYHHFECATYMYKTDCIKEIEEDFGQTLLKCRQASEETIRNEKFSRKLLGSIAKVLAPLM